MSLQRFFLIVLILAIGCESVSAERGVETRAVNFTLLSPTAAPTSSETPAETIIDPQIEVNKVILQTNSDEQMRVKVAKLLLTNQDPAAREAIIETLALTNNIPARKAVCQALIEIRTSQQQIPDESNLIEPLLGIFSSEAKEEALLAADAILIYKYQKIGPLLDTIVTDPNQPVTTRINVIEALKKLPELNTIIRLYKLVDDPNQAVGLESSEALLSLGFPVGSSSLERRDIIANLRNKGIVEVLKELLKNRDEQIRKYQSDLEALRKYTLTVLEDSYLSIGIDDASKGKFLGKYLADTRSWVKSWSLDKVLNWLKTPNYNIPADVETVLTSLISDPTKEIRLKILEILQRLPISDSASKLLAQFEVEQDGQVKNKILDTLGIVCTSQTAQVAIPPEIRQRILSYASEYLSDNDAGKAQIGAKVMRQFFEREGLQEQEIPVYLGQLSERYSKLKDNPNDTLNRELLSTMVVLVSDNSNCKEQARKAFEQFFTAALNNETDLIRETAIDGLRYIDRLKALQMLSQRIDTEKSEKARLMIISIAREVGGKDDLLWLANRLSAAVNSEPKEAWSVMLKIFGDSDATVLSDWETRLMSSNSKYTLSDSQKIEFYRIVLSKTPEENKPKYHDLLANLFFNTGQYDQAAKFFSLLYNAATDEKKKNEILPKFLAACLRITNDKQAPNLIMQYLSKNELTADNIVITTIDKYFNDPEVRTDKNAVLKSLTGISLAQDQPLWQEKLKAWGELLNESRTEVITTTVSGSN